MDDQLLYEMKKTGCRIMGLGIESGSDRILKLIGKNCTADSILNGLTRLGKAGILPTVSIMVGQDTETREDVEASVRLMRESVRIEPNIRYAFTITTPFPGSKLYDQIFRKRYLHDHQEFYDRYFSSSGDWKQVVNLSEMRDEEVREMYAKLRRAYREERARVTGKKTILLAYSQILLGRTYGLLTEKFLSKNSKIGLINRLTYLIGSFYDYIQAKLEICRLKFEGIWDKK
jgi:radical SAM superfamily enzyme YgiQ (UPF0313 family)